MAAISVLISSGGRKKHLYKSLESVISQDHPNYQIFIAVPQTRLADIDQSLNRRFFNPYAKNKKSWTLIPEAQFGEGKNWIIKNGPEGIVLFIDEDVSFPNASFLKRLDSFHNALGSIEFLGGLYSSTDDCSAAGRAYNQVARLWMEKHRNPEVIGKYNDMLVSGNMSLKLNRKTRQVAFPTENGFGGEEEQFLMAHWKQGHSSRVIENLSLNHHAHHDLKTFYKRAWLHGAKSRRSMKLSSKDLKHLFTHSGKGSEKLMVYSYLACTRASSLYNYYLKDLQRLIPGR